MFEKKMSQAEVIELLNKLSVDDRINVFSEKRWKYLWQGCNQKQCAMLDMNCAIEQRPGIVIHIPHKTLEDLNEGKVSDKV